MCPSSALPSCHPRARGQLVSIWPLFVDSICRLQDCSFLASGVCPLVDEDGLEVCAGFLAGRVGACPLVGGTGSWSSGGQSHA